MPRSTQTNPRISIILATHNRCDVVRETLAQLQSCGLERGAYEVIAVDNASTDGTPGVSRPDVDELIELRRNRGSCAKALGVKRARGEYLVFLDDDSCPRPGTLARMIERFEANPRLGCAGFAVHLPDGSQEGAALPHVSVGCGVGFRAQALREAGGLDASFFMQAEEYDLCFRIKGAGWEVATFADLHVDHRKTPTARRAARTTYYDIRNNLRVLARFAPAGHYPTLRDDCILRYRWIAERLGHEAAFRRGLRAGKWRGAYERIAFSKLRMSAADFEYFYRWGEIEALMRSLPGRGVTRVAFADFGKNVYGFWRGAQQAGVEVVAIGDDRFAAIGRTYRGVRVVSLEEAMTPHVDAIVVANSSPVHARVTTGRVESLTQIPVFSMSGRILDSKTAGTNFGTPSFPADNTGEAVAELAGR